MSTTGIQRMALEGSERALDNPLVRLEADVLKTQGVIFRNRAARGIVDALVEQQKATGEELVRFIQPKRTLDIAERVSGQALPRAAKGESSKLWETISYFKDGEQWTVEVPSIYGRVARGLEAEPDNILSSILRWTSAPLRHGAVTYNPAFLIVNPLRDGYSAFFREGLIPLSPAYLRGWIAVVKRNATFSEAAESGALLSGIVDTMRSTEAMSRVRTLGAINVRNPMDALLVIPRLIEKANITAEQATRVATYGKLRAEGLSQLDAAVRARDVTVDFAKSGITMRMINQVIPFSNAALQGTVNTARTIRDKPLWAAAATAPFMAATVMSRVNNMRFGTSGLIPDYEYTNNWVFQFGEYTKADGTVGPIYIKIPKGPIASMLTFPGEALFNLARQEEDRSVVDMVLETGIEAAKATSPFDPNLTGFLPPIAQTGAGVATGVDLYRGTPIIPRREQSLLPEQQVGPETSSAAVALGQQFNVSPRLLDYAINDYLAGSGQTGSWLLSLGLDAVGYDPEVYGEDTQRRKDALEGISKVPVAGRFIGTRATQGERRAWERFDEASEETQRTFSELPGMNALGIRLGEVGESFDLVPGGTGGSIALTPNQRAQYQRVVADTVISDLKSFLPTLPADLPPEPKEALLRQRLKQLKDDARKAFAPTVLRLAEQGGDEETKDARLIAGSNYLDAYKLSPKMQDPELRARYETWLEAKRSNQTEEWSRGQSPEALKEMRLWDKVTNLNQEYIRKQNPQLDLAIAKFYGGKPVLLENKRLLADGPHPLQLLEGIGETGALNLNNARIYTLQDFNVAPSSQLREILGVSAETMRKMKLEVRAILGRNGTE